QAGQLLEDGPEDLVTVPRRDRELLPRELLRRLDGRIGAQENPMRWPPVPKGDAFHLRVSVGACGDDSGDIRDADVALAGGDALDGVGRALAANNLHVKPFL